MIDTRRTLIDSDYRRWPRCRVTVYDSENPWPLMLAFAHIGDAPAFLGFEVLAEKDEMVDIGNEQSLDPKSFARLARMLPMYVEYALAEIEWKSGDKVKALEALRDAGKSRRGLPDKFYEEIGAEYLSRVAKGDPHPIKSIADERPVHKSRASRWVSEARRRGYITTEGGTDASLGSEAPSAEKHRQGADQ